MIVDERTEFADGVAVSGAAATRNVGDVIPLGNVRDIGAGQTAYVYVLVDAAPTGATTVEFSIVSDAVNPPATDGSATQHITTGAVPIADLPAGKRFVFALPVEGNEYEDYLGLQVTNVGATALANLVVTAGITLDPIGWKPYPEGAN